MARDVAIDMKLLDVIMQMHAMVDLLEGASAVADKMVTVPLIGMGKRPFEEETPSRSNEVAMLDGVEDAYEDFNDRTHAIWTTYQPYFTLQKEYGTNGDQPMLIINKSSQAYPIVGDGIIYYDTSKNVYVIRVNTFEVRNEGRQVVSRREVPVRNVSDTRDVLDAQRKVVDMLCGIYRVTQITRIDVILQIYDRYVLRNRSQNADYMPFFTITTDYDNRENVPKLVVKIRDSSTKRHPTDSDGVLTYDLERQCYILDIVSSTDPRQRLKRYFVYDGVSAIGLVHNRVFGALIDIYERRDFSGLVPA